MEQRDDRKSNSVILWVKLQDESSYVLFYFGFILRYISPIDIFSELFNKWLLPANCFKKKKWYIKDSLRPNLFIVTSKGNNSPKNENSKVRWSFVVHKTFQQLHSCLFVGWFACCYTSWAVWSHFMFFLVVFSFLKQVSSYFSWWGECCKLCCEAPEMFCGLLNFQLLASARGWGDNDRNFHFWVSRSFKLAKSCRSCIVWGPYR